ncbi:hypothetical protein QZH41_005870, partial [Actinostola sp. cb2023]
MKTILFIGAVITIVHLPFSTQSPGIPATIPLVVHSAENYPVDLYYLMDMSWSMANDLSNLKKLAGKIAAIMQNITKNYQLGFGSFVDKTVSPYTRI